MKTQKITLIISFILLSACSITDKVQDTTYKENISRGTSSDIVANTEKILHRYSYSIERTDVTSNRIRYETDWKLRLPSTSELEAKFEQVKTKIIVTARPRMRTEYGESRLYNVQFQGYTEYLAEGEEAWQKHTIDKEAEDYLKNIAYELRTELERVLHSN
ncbi:MAG: hypothetical protein WD511_01865 [Balneolaceae bacterium]